MDHCAKSIFFTSWAQSKPGGRLSINMLSYRYMYSIIKKRWSDDYLIFIMGISYLKRWSLYWDGAQMTCSVVPYFSSKSSEDTPWLALQDENGVSFVSSTLRFISALVTALLHALQESEIILGIGSANERWLYIVKKKRKLHLITHPLTASLRSGGCFKNAYELLNLRALKISVLYENPIFQCMG